MSRTKFTLLFVFCIISGACGSLIIWDNVLKSLYGIDVQVAMERMSERPAYERPDKTDSTLAPERAESHYIADSEISFIMNGATGYVRVPARRDWVRHYRLRKSRIAPSGLDSVITLSDGVYRFSAPLDEIRRMAADGARPLPVKTALIDMSGEKEIPFHVTHMILNFRDNGLVDAELEGYLFD